MTPAIPPELTFLRCVWIWNYWAFGVSRYSRRFPNNQGGRLDIVTFGVGPLRIQFFDTSKRWAA